jgi:hypothetical protein
VTSTQGQLSGLPARGVIALHGLESGVDFRDVYVSEIR